MEAKTTVSTAELRPLVSALKNEMQKKGYSPLSMRGLENVWDALLHYASTIPATAFDEKFREGFLQTEYGSVWIWNIRCTEPAVRLNS